MNRKQKAMEEAFRSKSSKPRNKDYRKTLTEEEFQTLIDTVQDSVENNRCAIEREYWCYLYKNGAKMFDRAVSIVNSPLMKALK